MIKRNMETISYSQADTEALAARLARSAKAGEIYCLYGTLGAGKSVFARAFIRTLIDDPRAEIPSPTFTLVQTYESSTAPVYHYDFYRIKGPEEVYELQWEDALNEGIVLAEWADRLGPLLPARRCDIHIEPGTGESRIIRIEHHES